MNNFIRPEFFNLLKVDTFFAKRTIWRDFEPIFDAFRMELIVLTIESQNLLIHHQCVQLFFDLLIGLRKVFLSFIVVHFRKQLFLQESLTNNLEVERFRTDDALIGKFVVDIIVRLLLSLFLEPVREVVLLLGVFGILLFEPQFVKHEERLLRQFLHVLKLHQTQLELLSHGIEELYLLHGFNRLRELGLNVVFDFCVFVSLL
jgi:hypothetical protein